MIDYYCDVTNHLSMLKKVLADGGCTGKNFANTIKALSGVKVEIVKRSKPYSFSFLPKYWIIERSFAWLDKCRRLWKNCERRLQNSLQMLSIAFIRLLLNRYETGSYSPDFNPIEMMWSKMKSILRKWKIRIVNQLVDAVARVFALVSRLDYLHWFQHVGYYQ